MRVDRGKATIILQPRSPRLLLYPPEAQDRGIQAAQRAQSRALLALHGWHRHPVLVRRTFLTNGAQLTVDSLKWVEADPTETGVGGGGGPGWVDVSAVRSTPALGMLMGRTGAYRVLDQRRRQYSGSVRITWHVTIHTDITGVTKAMTAFLSGEMKDTVEVVR